MRKAVWLGTLTAGLLTTTFLAAQEPNRNEAQQQSPPAQQQPAGQTIAPMGTNPGTLDGQPQAPLANQAKPADVGPAQANTANTGDSSGWPIGSTPQTVPSTMSARNAELDKLPTVAFQFPLNDEQKKLIVQSVAQAPKSPGAEKLANVRVWNFVPENVQEDIQATEFSAEIKQQLPDAGHYKFVKADKRVLIIDPVNEVVISEIPL
jgi:hypothetical protein